MIRIAGLSAGMPSSLSKARSKATPSLRFLGLRSAEGRTKQRKSSCQLSIGTEPEIVIFLTGGPAGLLALGWCAGGHCGRAGFGAGLGPGRAGSGNTGGGCRGFPKRSAAANFDQFVRLQAGNDVAH